MRALFSELKDDAVFVWFTIPPFRRSCIVVAGFAFSVILNGSTFTTDLLRDRDLATFLFFLPLLVLSVLALLARSLSFMAPTVYEPEAKHLAALTRDDLALLEALIEEDEDFRDHEDDECTFFSNALTSAARTAAVALEGREKRLYGEKLDRALVAAYWRLHRAGLLVDVRRKLYEDRLRLRLVDGARELLEEERERRSRVAPLGPRSRRGALAS